MQDYVSQDGKRIERCLQAAPKERSSFEIRENSVEHGNFRVYRIKLAKDFLVRLRSSRKNNFQIWTNSAQVLNGIESLHYVSAKLPLWFGHIVITHGCSSLTHFRPLSVRDYRMASDMP